jgi:signal transduction histidine kinase
MLRATNLEDLRGMGAGEFSRRFRVSYLDGRLVPPDQFVSQRVFDEAGPIRYKAVLNPPGEREIIIACTAAGVRSEIGEPPALVVSVMHDITATHHLERLRDELFTAAAHALKTPVTVIKSASQVLSSGAITSAPRQRSSSAMRAWSDLSKTSLRIAYSLGGAPLPSGRRRARFCRR